MHDKPEGLQYFESKKEVRRAKRFERSKKKVLDRAFNVRYPKNICRK